MNNRFHLLSCVFVLLLSACDTPVKTTNSCGDGFLDPGEQCDGAAISVANCLELGFYEQEGRLSCRPDCTLDVSACAGTCGDQLVQAVHGEDCDGSELVGETCLSLGLGQGTLACTELCRFDLTGCEVQAECGDGTITSPVEQCEGADLGEQTCETLGYYGGALSCDVDCHFHEQSCASFGRCGDGEIQSMYGEQCEGAELGGSTCASLGYHGGTLTCTADCEFDLTGCEAVGRCGDGVIQGTFETCDGTALGDQSCESLDYYGGALACESDCGGFDLTGCEAVGRCGDGVVQEGFSEVCDGANLHGESCTGLGWNGGTLVCAADCRSLDDTDCALTGSCGDLTLQTAYEDCDGFLLGTETCVTQGFNMGVLGCTDTCEFDTSQCGFGCGDEILDLGEVCDGTNFGGQVCSDYQSFTGELTCSSDCRHISYSGCKSASDLAAGVNHVCALLSDGTVKCWGSNGQGQLGDGTTLNSSIPRPVIGLSGVTALAAGQNFTCALLNTGSVSCWGGNGYGQLGDGSTANQLTPVPVSGIATATQLESGDFHSCARLSNGTLVCWGNNSSGQLGDGTTTHRTTPVAVAGISTATIVSAGGNHSCARLSDFSIKCWGSNGYGQLGDGTTTSSLAPVTVSGLGNAYYVNAGNYFTCATVAGGVIWCWGYNSSGQLGDGTIIHRSLPVSVSGLTGALSPACGRNHTCGYNIDNEAVFCWGGNAYGQLGDGTTTSSLFGARVQNLTYARKIVAGESFSCALLEEGEVKCWGRNESGQLGDHTVFFSTSPVPVFTEGATMVSTGSSHGCRVETDGGVSCWGSNSRGQLGDGTIVSTTAPVGVLNLSGEVTSVSAAGNSTCALLLDGTVRCWGGNTAGQLGDGTTSDSLTPVTVSGLTGAAALSHNAFSACALLTDGTVRCWGENSWGQLGDGTGTDSPLPVTVVGASNVTQVSVGENHGCARRMDGTVLCWGRNFNYQLGDGTSTDRLVPVQVSSMTTALAVSAGLLHSCALLGDSTVKCWGSNTYGQLGTGNTTYRSTPASVINLTGAVAIACGYNHSCALLSDGTAKCWGRNDLGQVGDGTLEQRTSPVTVTGLTDLTSITAGSEWSCALGADHVVRCWGDNNMGKLSLHFRVLSTTPIFAGP